MIFETQTDIDREESTVLRFVHHMTDQYNQFENCTFVKLGRFELDYLIQLRNGKRITIEVKGVNGHSVDSNHVPVVSVMKVEKMQKSVNQNGFNASYILFAYKDGIRFEELRNLKGRFCWSGRKEPRNGSTNDREMILIFDATEFKKITF